MSKIIGGSSSLLLVTYLCRYSFMRRNVRRLNREVGNIGGRDIVPEVHNTPQEEEEIDKYDKENGSKKSSKSRKAVNLAGLPSLAMFQN
jgi:hypothetical protein